MLAHRILSADGHRAETDRDVAVLCASPTHPDADDISSDPNSARTADDPLDQLPPNERNLPAPSVLHQLSRDRLADTGPGCEFCTKFRTVNPAPRWFDREIFQGDAFNVVPALGALTVGSVMVVTRQHYYSMRSSPLPLYMSVIAVAESVLEYLRQRGYPAIVFEHGGSLAGGGGCIDHAHLQIAPTQADLVSAILAEQGSAHFSKLDSLAGLPGAISGDRPYLLIQNQTGVAHISDRLKLSPQYVRRRLAAMTNQAESWDYLAFPQLDRVQATLDLFSDLQSFVEERL